MGWPTTVGGLGILGSSEVKPGVQLINGTPDRIRTCDLVLRRHALYPG
jgi:hypothetical protein